MNFRVECPVSIFLAEFRFRPGMPHAGCWIRKWGQTRKSACVAALGTYMALAAKGTEIVHGDSWGKVRDADMRECRRMLTAGSEEELGLRLSAAGF